VDNTGGYDNVTTKNGTIDSFAYGVFLTGASNNTLTDLEVRNSVNTTGVEGVGILLWLANDSNTISKNTIKDNDRQGMYLGCNPFAFSGVASDCDGKHADNNLIEKNEIKNNGKAGFDAYGIQLHFANGNVVSKNTISGHGAWFFGQGIYVLSSSNNLIEKNEVEENSFGAVLWDNGFAGTADGNTFSKNEFNENGAAGMWILGGTSGTLVEKNDADENGFAPSFGLNDGIRATGAGVTLTKNKANDNADLGIQASAVTDGGGNKAKGNGNPAQCTGITCK
jgi:parallel beta-helix repeat protein